MSKSRIIIDTENNKSKRPATGWNIQREPVHPGEILRKEIEVAIRPLAKLSA